MSESIIDALKQIETKCSWHRDGHPVFNSANGDDLILRKDVITLLSAANATPCRVCFEAEPHTGTCGSSDPRALCNLPSGAPVQSASPAETAQQEGVQPTWRCFHCDEVFDDSEQAALHFGTRQWHEPACQVSPEKLREMESDLERHREEDTDLHRQIYRMQSDHNTALQREEEKGYARGLADAAAPLPALPEGWRAMLYAPTDGTEVELLLHHANWRFAGDNRAQWEQVVRSKWIDHNGGGWTWRGMCGNPVGWRPIAAAPDQADRAHHDE